MKELIIRILRNIIGLVSNKSQDPPFLVVVYTMGKVGSSTLAATLRKVLKNRPVFHVHFLSKEWIELNADIEWHQKNINNANRIKDFIEQHPKTKIKIISIVREPVIRDLSNIFENPHLFFPDKVINEMGFGEFLTKLPKINHDYTLQWFEKEFKAYLGFDIYQHPFDKQSGYSIYQYGNWDILIIKLEKLNDCYKNAFKEFLDIDVQELIIENDSNQVETRKYYSMLKEVYNEPLEELQKIYKSKYMRHFYTNEEIKSLERKWASGKIN